MQRISIGLLMLLAGVLAVAWYTAPDMNRQVGVRAVFLRPAEFTPKPLPLQLSLASAEQEKTISAPVLPFSQWLVEPGFALPLEGEGRLTLSMEGEPLLEIGLKNHYHGVAVTHNCTRLQDLSQAYPRRRFPTYMPRGLYAIACRTQAGVVELQLSCKADAACW